MLTSSVSALVTVVPRNRLETDVHQAPVSGKERTRKCVLFFALVLLTLFPAGAKADATQAVDDGCEAVIDLDSSRVAQVKTVIDGDTLITEEGERIRLIGIDAPEISAEEFLPASDLAEQARAEVEKLFRKNRKVYLMDGVQSRDRYGRTLAMLLTHKNIDPAGLLLARGLAQTLAVPPNLRNANCYGSAERYAQSLGIGLWSPERWRILQASNAELQNGFHFLEGKVTRVGRSRKNHWMIVGDRIWVAVTWYDLPNFPKHLWPDQLENAKVRVKGRLFYSHGQWRLKLRHASALTVLERESDSSH